MYALTICLSITTSVSTFAQKKTADREEIEQRVKTLLQRSEFSSAKKILEKDLRLRPSSVKSLISLAEINSILGLNNEAILNYKKVLRLRPDHADALHNLAKLYLSKSNIAKAAGSLKSYVRLRPGDHEVLFTLGQCLIQLGREAEGEQFIDQAVLIGEETVTYRLREGQLLLASGLAVQALKHLEPALALTRNQGNQGSAVILHLLSQCYVRLGRFEDARRMAEMALEDDSSNEDSLLTLANILQLESRDAEVITLLEYHRQAFSSSPRFLFTLSFSYYNLGNFSVSRELAETVITLERGFHQAYYLLGNCLASLGDHEAAITHYRSAYTLAPDNSLFNFQLGLVLAKTGRKGEAKKYLIRSIQLNPAHAPAHYELAQIYFDSANYKQAVSALQKAIEVSPDFESPYYLLSQLYSKSNRPKEAAQMMRRFQLILQEQRDRVRRLKAMKTAEVAP
jgi:tetratricopeptide (TPR) repeat protein